MNYTKTRTDYRFTNAEMEIARETDLPDLLEHLGYQVRQIGRYHTTEEMDSLRIKNRRTWHRYSENTGGDAITFLQRFCNKSFSEAVEYLLAYHGRARDSPAKHRKDNDIQANHNKKHGGISMKRILTTLCALSIVAAGSVPALAADAGANPGQSASYYPISVEEYTYGSLDEPRIEKVYQLSLSDDPSGIPTEDFVRGGRLYYLLDMTRKNEVGVDTKLHTESVTKPSDTNDLEKILQQLDAELEVTTEDGYTGTLQLDHTTVKVAVDGYDTKTQALSASRSYPNLSEADVSLIPKSIEDNGKTLTLADVQWASTEQTDGAGGIVTRYTATASYTGSSSYQYATGYTVTADYTGEVAKPNCDVVTYTAIFGSTEAPEESTAPGTEQETDSESAKSTMDLSVVKIPLLVGGVAIALAAGGVFAYKKIKERR